MNNCLIEYGSLHLDRLSSVEYGWDNSLNCEFLNFQGKRKKERVETMGFNLKQVFQGIIKAKLNKKSLFNINTCKSL